MSKKNKILQDRINLLNQLKKDYSQFALKNNLDDVRLPIATAAWNLFCGKYSFSAEDLKWIVNELNKPVVVKNNSVVEIKYVKGNAVQLKRMVSINAYEAIRANKEQHAGLSAKQQKEFEKTHKIKLDADEVVEDSPLGLAIMGKSEYQWGLMVLPACQGGEHIVLVNKIYESEEINTPALQD